VIPAVTHVDGSARLQTVRRESHPRYYDVIKSLGDKTGVPVVLNTSFNIQGEPVVESPQDAIRCFFSTGLDFLVIGNFLLKK
jgi:carbamoyltransferase